MKDREDAIRLLDMARKDLTALENMDDPCAFPDEVFGFHAQQAAEKSLKAWLALLGREYPMTHDLSFLLRLLEDAGADIERFWGLVEFNAFAVQFRYEAYDGQDAPLHRGEARGVVKGLTEHVEGLL
jgi:HEPN domain-containing protein